MSDGWVDRTTTPGIGLQAALKLAVVLLFFAAWAILYDRFNHQGADPTRTIRLTRPIDRIAGITQPWTAVIYVFGGIALPLLAFWFHWEWARLRFVLACYTLTSLLAFACYWSWPLGIVRPDFIDQLLTTHVADHPAYYGTMVWILMMLEQWFQQHQPQSISCSR